MNTIRINSTQVKQSKSSKNDGSKSSNNTDQNDDKFKIYYDFHTTTKAIKPHQILAINRGENQKVSVLAIEDNLAQCKEKNKFFQILKVTIDIPDHCKTALYNFLYKKYGNNVSYKEREQVLELSFNEYISKKCA